MKTRRTGKAQAKGATAGIDPAADGRRWLAQMRMFFTGTGDVRLGALAKRLTDSVGVIGSRDDARGRNSSRNTLVSLAVSCVTSLFSFVSRTVFIRCLSSDYLGLSGLFSNILSFLSLADLGIGNALNYALYAPLATGDTDKVKSLMRAYRTLYTVVGVTVLALGLALVPFLPQLIDDPPEGIPMRAIRLYFVLSVAGTSTTYLFTHKRALIVCDQREFVSTVTSGVFRVLASCLQIAVLAAGGGYVAYLLVGILCTVLDNLAITRVANALYPYLRDGDARPLGTDERQQLRKNAVAIFFHKVGGIAVFASDNLLIAKFIGLVQVGLYSNYTMLVSAANSLANKVMLGMAASIGNLMAKEDDRHTQEAFYHILFLNAWLYGLTSLCLVCLVQPFIALWLGGDYLLPGETVVLAVLVHYVGGVRTTLLLFKDAAGVFRQDRFKPLVEAAVNLAVSIPLVRSLGITGILLGTLISTVGVAFWYEAYTFFRVRYRTGFGRYLCVQLGYLLFNALLSYVALWMCSHMDVPGFGGVALMLLICLVLYNVAYLLSFGRTRHFAYFRSFVDGLASRAVSIISSPSSKED